MEPVLAGSDTPVLVSVEPIAVSLNQAASLLGIGRSTMEDLVRRGEVPAKKIGARVTVNYRGLREWHAAGGAVAGQRKALG